MKSDPGGQAERLALKFELDATPDHADGTVKVNASVLCALLDAYEALELAREALT